MKKLQSILLLGSMLCAQQIIAMRAPELKSDEDIKKLSPRQVSSYRTSILSYLTELENLQSISARQKSTLRTQYLNILSSMEKVSGSTTATEKPQAWPIPETAGISPKKFVDLPGMSALATGANAIAIAQALTEIKKLIGSPDDSKLKSGLSQGGRLKEAQDSIMVRIEGNNKNNFNEENLPNNPQKVLTMLNTVTGNIPSKKDKEKSDAIVELLMLASCALANIEAGAAGSSSAASPVAIVNKALNTNLPLTMTASDMLELAVRAPIMES